MKPPLPAISELAQSESVALCSAVNFGPQMEQEYSIMKKAQPWLPAEPLSLCAEYWLNSEKPEESLGLDISVLIGAKQSPSLVRIETPFEIIPTIEFASLEIKRAVNKETIEKARASLEMIAIALGNTAGSHKIIPLHIQYLLGCSNSTALEIFNLLESYGHATRNSEPGQAGGLLITTKAR